MLNLFKDKTEAGAAQGLDKQFQEMRRWLAVYLDERREQLLAGAFGGGAAAPEGLRDLFGEA